MNDTIERLADGTLDFLPVRLNRDPARLRGLTNDEMRVALGVGALVGLVLDAPLAIRKHVEQRLSPAGISGTTQRRQSRFGDGPMGWRCD